MKLTGNYRRVAIRSMQMDAGQLREQLVEDMYQWQVEGTKTPDWVRSFWVKLKKLAKMTGMTQEDVHRDIQKDAEMLADVEDEGGRLSAARAKNPFAICTDAMKGKQHTKKWKKCVEDIKDEEGIEY